MSHQIKKWRPGFRMRCERPLRDRVRFLWRLVLGVGVALGAVPAWAGLTHEGPYTVFRSDTQNPVLLTSTNILAVPGEESVPELRFNFGFSTEEVDAPGAFFDSFSVTLQSADAGATSLLLTADRSGVAWAPPNAGGLIPTNLSSVGITFAPLEPLLTNWVAYAVSWLLPQEFARASVWLFADFFDNQDSARSLAYLSDVRIESLHATKEPTVLVVRSSASVLGPFAEEAGAVVDFTNRTVTLPGDAQRRFFRVSSEYPSEIARLQVDADTLRLRYAVRPAGLTVEGAAKVEGPYGLVTGWKFDAERQAVRLVAGPGMRFFRLRSEVALRVEGATEEGSVLLFYDLKPSQARLWSSSRAEGPYTSESVSALDLAARWVTIPRWGQARFYRLLGDVPVRIRSVERRASEVVLKYELP